MMRIAKVINYGKALEWAERSGAEIVGQTTPGSWLDGDFTHYSLYPSDRATDPSHWSGSNHGEN